MSGLPNYVWGTSGNDKLVGSNKDDIIIGLAGRDKINGKGGDDQIVPGASAEGKFTKVKGGKGLDIFEVSVYAKVVIKDFDIAEDFLALDGGIDNASWEINGKKTHIYNFDGSDWVVINGKVNLSEVMSF